MLKVTKNFRFMRLSMLEVTKNFRFMLYCKNLSHSQVIMNDRKKIVCTIQFWNSQRTRQNKFSLMRL